MDRLLARERRSGGSRHVQTESPQISPTESRLKGRPVKGLTAPALYMGALAAFVGYSASFAIVLAGLNAMGATDGQAATGLFFATVAMGVSGIWLPFVTHTPAAVAWSAPGAAFLAASTVLPGGFAEAVGALLLCAVLIVLTGVVPAMARAVAAIPKPIANALLAGVLLKLCLAPAIALGSLPILTLPIFLAWVVGLTWNRLLAMPLAVIALVIVLVVAIEPSSSAGELAVNWRPDIDPVAPTFSWTSAVSIALPLYLVTMAGQNIPGFAVLELNSYRVNRPFLLRSTGLVSLGTAPFGAIPVNMSAITASMMAGEDAGPDPRGRYWAAIVSGICYLALALAASAVTSLARLVPPELITAVAGLALIPAFVAALRAAFNDTAQLEATALTFLLAASGISLLGVSGAVWGIVAGSIIWLSKAFLSRA
ncbi:MAG: benzoate/H(+) symporter BenE family transporter [Pseudomonadota bacterium]